MKKIICLSLIFLLVSPAFASWLPHGVAHALHENNIKHLLDSSHQHSPHQHSLDYEESIVSDENIGSHHPIHIDIASYYDDYLNADLQRLSPSNLHISIFDFYQIDCFYSALDIMPNNDGDFLRGKNHSPIDWKIFNSSTTPLYLSTQRLRI